LLLLLRLLLRLLLLLLVGRRPLLLGRGRRGLEHSHLLRLRLRRQYAPSAAAKRFMLLVLPVDVPLLQLLVIPLLKQLLLLLLLFHHCEAAFGRFNFLAVLLRLSFTATLLRQLPSLLLLFVLLLLLLLLLLLPSPPLRT